MVTKDIMDTVSWSSCANTSCICVILNGPKLAGALSGAATLTMKCYSAYIGTAWNDKKEFKRPYLTFVLRTAGKSVFHRKLGKKLDLFSSSKKRHLELVFWHP